MFQLDWYNKKLDNYKKNIISEKLNLFSKKGIVSVQYSFWAEHCVECSAPKCYKSCKNFEKRSDFRCKRTENGQKPITIHESILGYGTQLKFKKWGKIETYIYKNRYSLNDYLNLNKKYCKFIEKFSKSNLLNPARIFNNYNYFKITRNKKNRSKNLQNSDIFLIEIYSLENYDFSLFIEGADSENKAISRKSIIIKPGFNTFKIKYDSIAPNDTNAVRIYPDNCEPELIILNLEFIETIKNKIKCVVWDLDNTIWDGILSETEDLSKLKIRNGVKKTIETLDKRGIVQSISSKNEFDVAFDALKKLEIDKYFLYPKINWQPKSANLMQIAKDLNLGLDSFAFIDDMHFEREEVSNAIPQVRTYDENADILNLPEFDVIVTEESSRRREMYKEEENRKEIANNFLGTYIDFLRDCEIKVSVGIIDKESDPSITDRCFDLVNRTNQLNISGHRYTESSFLDCLKNSKGIYFSCSDKYGNYGIVGYMSYVCENGVGVIQEFALSCRVAKKHIEKAVISWLVRYEKIRKIKINYIKTAKNEPIRNSLEEAGFVFQNTNSVEANLDTLLEDENIILINLIN